VSGRVSQCSVYKQKRQTTSPAHRDRYLIIKSIFHILHQQLLVRTCIFHQLITSPVSFTSAMGTQSGGIFCTQPADDMITNQSDDPFPDLPPDSPESLNKNSFKPRLHCQSLKRPAEADYLQESSSSSRKTRANICTASNSAHLSVSPSPTTCLILREDNKALPFNFFNIALPKWPALECLLEDSLERNQKGTVIRGQLDNNKLAAFHGAPFSFELNKINYLVKVPQIHTPYSGEVVFDLQDIEDKSLLSLSKPDIKAFLTVSPSSKNSIKTV